MIFFAVFSIQTRSSWTT